MVSIRPSVFNQRERSDGGPFLIIEVAETEQEGVNVLFTDIPASERKSDSPGALLLNVCSDRITIYPLNVREDRDDYLQPKYGTLKRIIVTRPVIDPYTLPETIDDVFELLEQLPDGFSKNFRFGLGLLWEYRQICETAASLKNVDTLIVHNGNDVKIDSPFFMLGIKRFHDLRKELNRIASRHQREARKDKQFYIYQNLLHAADSSQFPARKKSLRPDALAEMTDGGRQPVKLSKRDRRAAVCMVQGNMEEIAESEPHSLLALKNDIELITLNQLIERYQGMLGKELPESKWQSFFLENPFILSLAFAVPAMLIQGQAYAGGKRLNGTGGKFADFLYASASTGNLCLIEIKKPKTELLEKSPYRGDEVFGPSKELGGAIAQILDQRFKLQSELPIIKNNMNRYDIHSYAVRSIVVAGTTPKAHQERKSFELVRNAFAGITIVTFDELFLRLCEIKNALQPFPAIDKDLF